jgi:tryptophanyl-tRNA synthetase
MIADLHTMTTPFSPDELRKNRLEVAMDYLAAGLDPQKSIIFAQSDLADLHAQLMFYFTTVVSVARMRHLPTFKEKVKQYPHNINMALLNYPVLMAADILIYKASAVPVGIDQEPHLEIAREIARKMNETYGTDFPQPYRFETEAPYVPSLLGEGKMSKSIEGSYINLTDDLETIKKRLAAVPTDSGKGIITSSRGDLVGIATPPAVSRKQRGPRNDRLYISGGQKSHGVAALLEFVELFQGKEPRLQYEKQYTSTGIQYNKLKTDLAEAIFKQLEPIQKRRREFESDPQKVEKILKGGAGRARVIAQQTVADVRQKMGLLTS